MVLVDILLVDKEVEEKVRYEQNMLSIPLWLKWTSIEEGTCREENISTTSFNSLFKFRWMGDTFRKQGGETMAENLHRIGRDSGIYPGTNGKERVTWARQEGT